MADEIFNEDSLMADVVERWGEHGAHADVLRTLIVLARRSQGCPTCGTGSEADRPTVDVAAERDLLLRAAEARSKSRLAAGVLIVPTVEP